MYDRETFEDGKAWKSTKVKLVKEIPEKNEPQKKNRSERHLQNISQKPTRGESNEGSRTNGTN